MINDDAYAFVVLSRCSSLLSFSVFCHDQSHMLRTMMLAKQSIAIAIEMLGLNLEVDPETPMELIMSISGMHMTRLNGLQMS